MPRRRRGFVDQDLSVKRDTVVYVDSTIAVDIVAGIDAQHPATGCCRPVDETRRCATATGRGSGKRLK